MPWPPTRIRQRANSPKACQKEIWRHPKSAGVSQFHRCITSSPPIQMKRAIAGGPIKISANSFFFVMLCSLFLRFVSSIHFLASSFSKLVVNAPQSFAEMKHCVTFAREQRVDVDAVFY